MTVLVGLVASVCQPFDLAHGALSGREQRPKQHGRGLRRRQDGLVLMRRLNSSCIDAARRAPLAKRQAGRR
jgi:hypothetical protein